MSCGSNTTCLFLLHNNNCSWMCGHNRAMFYKNINLIILAQITLHLGPVEAIFQITISEDVLLAF